MKNRKLHLRNYGILTAVTLLSGYFWGNQIRDLLKTYVFAAGVDITFVSNNSKIDTYPTPGSILSLGGGVEVKIQIQANGISGSSTYTGDVTIFAPNTFSISSVVPNSSLISTVTTSTGTRRVFRRGISDGVGGPTRDFFLRGTANGCGPQTVYASVTAAPGESADINPGNNDLTVSAEISCPQADLSIASISHTPTALYTDQNVNFTINYKNDVLSDLTATNPYLEVKTINGVYQGFSGPGISDGGAISGGRKFLLPALAPGAQGSLTVSMKINGGLLPGTTAGISGFINDSVVYESQSKKTNNGMIKVTPLSAPLADLGIVCTGVGVFDAGNLIGYLVNYTNAGPMSGSNIEVKVTPSQYITNLSFSPAYSQQLGNEYIRSINNVPPLSGGSIFISGNVQNRTAGTQIVQGCNITGLVSDNNLANNQSNTLNILNIPSSDLAINSIVPSFLTGPSGTNVEFTIQVSNNGSRSATGVTIFFEKNNLSLVSGSHTISQISTNLYKISLADMSYPPSSTQIVKITAKILGTAGDFSTFSGYISSSQFDSNLSNNNGSGRVYIGSGIVDCIISSVVLSDESPASGQNITANIFFTNGGNVSSNIQNISVGLNGLSYVASNFPVSYNGSRYSFSQTRNLIPGSTGSLQLTLRGNGLSTGQISLFASLVCNGGVDPNLDNNIFSGNYTQSDLSTKSADLSVSIITTPELIQTGNVITYTIDYKNNGPALATDVVLLASFSGALRNIDADRQYYVTASGYVFNLGALDAGYAGVIKMYATAFTGGSQTTFFNVVQITGSSLDTNSGNNIATGISYVPWPYAKLKQYFTGYCIGPNDSRIPTDYTDLANGNEFLYEIYATTNCDIFYGYKRNYKSVFLPNQSIIRAEMVFALVRVLKFGQPVQLNKYVRRSRFVDLGNKQNVIATINLADELGLLRDYKNGLFRPYDKITPAEALKLIQKASLLKTNSGSFKPKVEEIIQKFNLTGTTSSTSSTGSKYLPRGVASAIVYHQFKTAIKLGVGNNNRYLLNVTRKLATIPDKLKQVTIIRQLIQQVSELSDKEITRNALEKRSLVESLMEALKAYY